MQAVERRKLLRDSGRRARISAPARLLNFSVWLTASRVYRRFNARNFADLHRKFVKTFEQFKSAKTDAKNASYYRPYRESLTSRGRC